MNPRATATKFTFDTVFADKSDVASEAARARLVNLLERAAAAPKKRKPTKPRAAARERRLAAKKRRSDVKRLRTADYSE